MRVKRFLRQLPPGRDRNLNPQRYLRHARLPACQSCLPENSRPRYRVDRVMPHRTRKTVPRHHADALAASYLNSRIRRVCVTAFSYAIMTSQNGPCTNQCPIRHIRIVTGVLLYTAYCAIFLPLCPDNRQNRPDAGRCHCLCRRRCFPCAEKQHRRSRTRRRAGSGRKSGSKFLFFICLFLFRLHLPPCMPFSA